MSVDKEKYVSEVLSSKFSLNVNDFQAIELPEKTGPSVILVSDEGIDLGESRRVYDHNRTWKGITSDKNDEKFKVEINGKVVDTRAAFTKSAATGLYLLNPEIHEYAWLTGEQNTFKDLRYGSPYVLHSDSTIFLRTNEYKDRKIGNNTGFRFRPVINLNDL